MIENDQPVIGDVPLTVDQFIAHKNNLAAHVDYELGKDVVEKLNQRQTNRAFPRGRDRYIWQRSALLSIAAKFRGVNCVEVWRVAGNVRFRDGKKPKTPLIYENAGRSKERCLAKQLRAHYENRRETLHLLDDLESCIRAHLQSLNVGESVRAQKIRKCSLSVELMRLLADVWVEDSETLKAFLSTMFQRWRKIDDPRSVWRRRMVIHQKSTEFGHDCKRLQEYLESIRVVEKVSMERQENAVRNLIAQDLSRGPRNRKRNQ